MRKAKNKGHQILDKDLQKASGGTVIKVIFDDGSVRYITSESESSLYLNFTVLKYPVLALSSRQDGLAGFVG